MTSISQSGRWTWIGLGAAVAALLPLAMAQLQDQPSLRSAPMLIIVILAGAVAGFAAYTVRYGTPSGTTLTAFPRALSLVVYVVLVVCGYLAAQMVPT